MTYDVASYRIATKVLTEEFNKRAAEGWQIAFQVKADSAILVTWVRP